MNWLERLDVVYHCGDLFTAPAAAAVCPVNVHLALNYGLGRRLAQLGGTPLLQAIDETARGLPEHRLRLGQAVTVDIPEPWGDIGKVILAAWWDADNAYTHPLLYGCIINALRQAFEARIGSLAMPFFGMGSGQLRISDLGGTITQVLKDLDGLRSAHLFPLETLYLVSIHGEDLRQMREYLDRHIY
jgi:O-acetyl-ADP-ribose deacetylase (regulator of RNase III)